MYNVYNTFFSGEKPQKTNSDALDTILNIKCINLGDLIKAGDFEKKLTNVEKALEKSNLAVQEQNRALHNIVQANIQNNSSSGGEDGLSYAVVSRMVKDFCTKFGNSSGGTHVLSKSLLRGKITSIHVKIHSVNITQFDGNKFSIQVRYGDLKNMQEDVKPNRVDFEAEFPVNGLTGPIRHLSIEVFSKKTQQAPKKILFSNIDLAGFLLNTVTKVTLRLHEEDPMVYTPDHKVSEVDVSILLDAVQPVVVNLKDQKPTQPFFVSDLESVRTFL